MSRTLSWSVLVLVAFAGCGDDAADDASSDERAADAIAAYCRTAVKCELDSTQEHCEWEWNLRFMLNFGSESKACRAAEIDEYVCFSKVSCDDLETGCEDVEERKDDTCGP